MGIPTDPGYKLYVSDCFCWPSGHTPKKLYVGLSGIQPGVNYQSWMPSAPNGNYRLEWQEPHFWKCQITDWLFQYMIYETFSFFSATTSFLIPGFRASVPEPCVSSFDNQLDQFADYYHDGTATLLSRES